MKKNELAEKIRLSIKDSSLPFWFPNLTPNLAEIGWQSLKNEFGLTTSDYCTSKMLSGNVNISYSAFPYKDKFGQKSFNIEFLPKELTENYIDSQIDFYKPTELSKHSILDCLTEAVELIKTIPDLSNSVFTLVQSLHLIKLDDDNYDVSFSEPHIPFSIFVSIPQNRIKADSMRVAEAIVHEAMHLQLSLIEKIVPLINSNEQLFYSPWKNEYRNSTGILHALYVFRVIKSFYKLLKSNKHFSRIDSDFIEKRQSEILLQISEIKDFIESADLTESGFWLTERLLS